MLHIRPGKSRNGLGVRTRARLPFGVVVGMFTAGPHAASQPEQGLSRDETAVTAATRNLTWIPLMMVDRSADRARCWLWTWQDGMRGMKDLRIGDMIP